MIKLRWGNKSLNEPIENTMACVKHKLDENSPEIFLALGIISFVGTVVAACRATIKAEEILDKHERMMSDIEDAYDISEKDPENYDYDEELYDLDKRNQKIKTGVSMARAYAPVVALGTISVVCILTSRNIMQKRYLALVTAYNGLTEIFDQYRQRVRDEEGDIMDRHYRYGTPVEEITKTEVDEDGKKHKVAEKVEGDIPADALMDATVRWMDENNIEFWDPNPTILMMQLRGQQEYWKKMIRARRDGTVFLNEVLQSLGFDKCQEGARLGWQLDGRHEGNIDFGLYMDNDNTRAFVNGKSNRVLLQFNVDGVIWDKLKKGAS